MTRRLTLADTAAPNLPQELLDDLPRAEAAAQRNLEQVKSAHRAELEHILAQLKEVGTHRVPSKAKVIRLRHLAGEYTKHFASQTACRTGCNHCCHIKAPIPEGEAKLIAKAIGRKVVTPKNVRLLDGQAYPSTSDEFFGVPCTFLKEGACSIYAHRPLVCRALVSMDDVDTLCRLVPGGSVPVPYLNTGDLQLQFILLHQDEPFADIREWFPSGIDAQKA